MVCFEALNCGCFSLSCTMESRFKGCSGKTAVTEYSRNVLREYLEKAHSSGEFSPGRCQICGENADVSAVSAEMSACFECWFRFIVPRREHGGNHKEIK